MTVTHLDYQPCEGDLLVPIVPDVVSFLYILLDTQYIYGVIVATAITDELLCFCMSFESQQPEHHMTETLSYVTEALPYVTETLPYVTETLSYVTCLHSAVVSVMAFHHCIFHPLGC